MCKKTSWSLFLILICLASSKEISQLGWAGINLFLGLLFLWTVVKIPALLDIGNGFYHCIFNKVRFFLGLCSNFAMLGLLANFFSREAISSTGGPLVIRGLGIRGFDYSRIVNWTQVLVCEEFSLNYPRILCLKNYFWYKITNF
jgi:hypothetical protein